MIIKLLDTKEVIIDGRLLDGIVTRLQIKEKVIYDSANIEGASGQKKVFSGFDDAAVSINLLLYGNDLKRNEKDVKKINEAFKVLIEGEPQVHQVENRLMTTLKINNLQVIDLTFSQTNQNNSIPIQIEMQEHNPVVNTIQQQQIETRENDGTELNEDLSEMFGGLGVYGKGVSK